MRIFMIIAVLVIHSIEASHSVCSEPGVFTNPNDKFCLSYIFCLRLSGGVFIEQLYHCPNGSMFNPDKRTCDEKYDCETRTTGSSVTDLPKTEFECVAQGKFPVPNDLTCTQYFFCYYLPSGNYLKRNYTCPSGSKFNPKLQICSQIYNCNNQLSTTPATTVSHYSTTEVSTSFNCTKQGRFPVEEDLTCRSYHECFSLPNGTFIEIVYFCPSVLRFDPKIQSCNANYQCPQQVSLSTTQSNIFNCPTTGRFPDDTDTSCRGYFYCIRLPNGNLGFQNYNCPEGETFDVQQQTCSSTVRCNSSFVSSTSPSTTTSSLTSTTTFTTTPSTTNSTTTLSSTSTTKTVNCVKQGRFPVQEDETCQLYFLCVIAGVGEFAQQIFKCPDKLRFNPETQNCTSDYQCGKDSSTSSTQNNYFSCPSKGRFPDDTDKACKRYFYCVYLPNEELGFQIFSCPEGRNFDPKLQVCNDNYNCSIQPVTSITESKVTTTFSILTLPPREKTTEMYLSTAPNENTGESSSSTDIFTKSSTVDTKLSSDVTGITNTIRTISSTDIVSDENSPQDISTGNFGDISTVTKETERSEDTTDNYTTKLTTDDGKIICESIGNLPDISDYTCASYFACEAGPNGEFKATKKKCEFQLFDPELKECSSTYSCQHDIGETSTIFSKIYSSSEAGEHYTSDTTFRYTFSSHTGSLNTGYTTDVDEHDRNTDNCVIDDDTSRNPVEKSSNYPRISSSMAKTTTEEYISDTTKYFGRDSCQSVGRFPIMDDRTCKNYYLCVVGPNGDLISVRYSCVNGELFDPVLGKCSLTYTCDRVDTSRTNLFTETKFI